MIMVDETCVTSIPEDVCRQNFIPGKSVDAQTGKLTANPDASAIFEPIRVIKGAVVCSLDGSAFQIHFYSARIREELIHTYTYDDESIYTYYFPERSSADFSAGPVTIETDGFIRIVLKDRTDASFAEKIMISNNGPVQFVLSGEQAEMHQKILDAIAQQRTKDDALFILLSDTHYGCGSNFEQTAYLIESIAKDVSPDALIHLGDLTDGSLPEEWTKKYALRVIRTLKKICTPCFFLIGNHDYNYFRDNPDRFSRKKCEDIYLDGRSGNRVIDLPGKELRLIFLESYDPAEKHPYGFSLSEIWFLIRALASASGGVRSIIFSHVPPLSEIHVWDKNIRNSNLITGITAFFRKFRHASVVYIHGHNHCDQVYMKKSFPIIGIGPSKLEDFQIKKPEGSVTPLRKQYDGSSALFDLLLVKETELCFFRYGAGEDRTVRWSQ